MQQDLLLKDECFKIVGLCMRVHRKLGMGFKEAVYQDALEIEFRNANIPCAREKKFKIEYEDVILRHSFDADFFLYNSILLEIKATTTLHRDNFHQLINYLKSSQVKLGLLVNFGSYKLQYERIICTY